MLTLPKTLRLKHVLIFYFCATFLAALCVIVATGSGAYRECSEGKEADNSDNVAHYPSNVSGAVSRWWRCEWFALNENEGIVVGLFTALLFVATWRLWKSTEKLWAAGERQQEVMRQTERAYFFPLVKHNFSEIMGTAERWNNSGSMSAGQPKAVICFKNHGKSPGIIREIVVSNIVLAENQPTPFRGNHMERSQDRDMVSPDRISGAFISQMDEALTIADAIPLKHGVVALWFRVTLFYDDVFGGHQGRRFTFRFRHRRREGAGGYHLEIQDSRTDVD